MGKRYFTDSFYKFFIELTLNNQKSWFDINRKRYEVDVKGVFEYFISDLILEMASHQGDFIGLTAKECIFRINRDIRFSKDKSPYKLFCSASIHKGGRKSMLPGGIYLELGPEKCAIYSGIYMPEKEELYKIRQNIASNLVAFDRAIHEERFLKYFGHVRGEKNKKIDSVFKDALNEQNLLLNKQYYVMHEFEAEKTLEDDFLSFVIDVWNSAHDFNIILGWAL